VKADIDMVMQIMHSFREATGLCINVSKSTVAPIKRSQINLDEVLQNFAGAISDQLSRSAGNSWSAAYGAPAARPWPGSRATIRLAGQANEHRGTQRTGEVYFQRIAHIFTYSNQTTEEVL
jgi:hypothetical protein